MGYPILYAKNATSFFNLGLGVLLETTKCNVIEERNGVFELTMEYPLSGTLFPIIENDLILKCDAGHALKEQLFRIKKITKTNDKMVEIYAQHISYLTGDLVLRPEVTFRGSAYNALTEWKGSILDENPFIVDSDIMTEATTTLTIQECENARRALGGVPGSILATWGGEYRFDNYHISLLNARGGSANTLIAYGRNLTDLNQEDNIESTYTSVMPYAIYRSDAGTERIVTIDGYIIDSEHLNKFPNCRISAVDLSTEFSEGEEPTPAGLRTLAEQYIRANNIGVPKVSLKVSFVDLTKSLNFTGSSYEELNLCDTVPVYFEALDIKTRAKIVKIEWNVLLDRYESLELGDTRLNLSDKLNRIENNISETNRNLNSGLNYALTSANGRNTVFYGANEPVANRVGDLWYKPNGEETELYIWNGVAWAFIMSTAPDKALLETIENAEREAQLAGEKADEAFTNAELARGEVQEAFAEIASVKINVDGLKTDVSQVSILAQGIQTQVTQLDGDLTTTKSQVTQLSNQLNITVQDLADLDNVVSSNYTQLTNAINLRVQKNDIINQINISTEGILIAGQKIHITGQTHIDNAVITSAMIASINADKITTGTLNAANVNIINLDVNNLTGNKTNFVQSYWNNISSSLQVNALGLSLQYAGSQRISINSQGFNLYHPNGLPAGAYSWAFRSDNPDNIGAVLRAESHSFLGIDTTLGQSGSQSWSLIRIEGNYFDLDVWGMRLQSNVRANGYGFVDAVDMPRLNVREISTYDYVIPTSILVQTWTSNGVAGLMLINHDSTAGIFFPYTGGSLSLLSNGKWYDV